MGDIYTAISVVLLNVNDINMQWKDYKNGSKKKKKPKKQDPTVCCLQDLDNLNIETHRDEMQK